MQVFHELGHVTAAIATGGTVTNLVLHPLSISRIDVAPNPLPLVVGWAGPCLGCFVPVLITTAVRQNVLRMLAEFFAGFCLLANGAYVAFGSIDRIGDCEVLLRHGSPHWLLILFGSTVMFLGAAIWHQLGSVSQLFQRPEQIPEQATQAGVLALLGTVLVLAVVSGP